MPPDPAAARVYGRAAGLMGRLGTRNPGAAAIRDGIRLRAYTFALCFAFGLYFLVQGFGRGPAFWLVALAVGVGLAAGLTRRDPASGRTLSRAALAAAGLSVAVPLGAMLLAGESLAVIAATEPLWPPILVCLFASRVLAEACDQRFAAFWRTPLRPHGAVQIQSTAAAITLGLTLTLLFYQAVAVAAPAHGGGTSLGSILASALAGETAIHRSIVFVFLVIVAYLGEAWRHHRRNRTVLAAIRAGLAERTSGAAPLRLDALLAGPFEAFAQTRTVRCLTDAVWPGNGSAGALPTRAYDGFYDASRRFVRGLLPFLPLLGFFGTVVGLATAMAALPAGGEGGKIDLSGSLSGLALKFETTLLGIFASMVASLLLALLEKREMELVSECRLLAEAAESRDGP